MHWLALRRINALELPLPVRLGNPNLLRLGRAVAFVLLNIGGLGFALVAPIWVVPWVAINVAALVLGSLSWSEDKRIRRESATAIWRQGAKVRAAGWRNLEELQREAQRQHQEAERRQRQEEDEREAQKRLQTALRQTQEQLREAEQRLHEAKEREKQRQKQSEQAERLRQAEQQRAEQRRRQAEEEREAQRKRRREHKRVTAQFKSDWWIVLRVAPSASKDEIVRKYRHKIKQCHPDRLVGLAPELLKRAEEQTKALNGAYADAMRARGYGRPNGAAA